MSDCKADIWMPLCIGDYLADTSHLSTVQHGAYLLLLMHYWRKGPLPNDPEQLANICKLTLDAWSIAQAVLVQFFSIEDDGKLHQKRADREIATALGKRKEAKDKASKAAQKRWGKHTPSNASSNAPSIPQAMHKQCPLPAPLPIEEEQDQTLLSDQSSDGMKLADHRRHDDCKIPIRRVFDHYREKIGKSAAYTLNDQRMRQGLARFKDGIIMARALRPNLPMDELPDASEKLMLMAVDQMALSDYHMGREGGGTVYNEWDNLFRSQSMFQKWVDKKLGTKHTATLQPTPAGQSFAERNAQ